MLGWEGGCTKIKGALGLPADAPAPAFPLLGRKGANASLSPNSPAASGDVRWQAAKMAAAYIPFLNAGDLIPPKLHSRVEMESILLDLSVLDEYFGEEGQAGRAQVVA